MRMIRANVRGALNNYEAKRVAKSLVNSPLVKTMVAGADPNVGRLLMAVGKCFDCTITPANTDAWINGHPVVVGGQRLDFEDAPAMPWWYPYDRAFQTFTRRAFGALYTNDPRTKVPETLGLVGSGRFFGYVKVSSLAGKLGKLF